MGRIDGCGRSLLLPEDLLVGRAHDCGLVLDDALVSWRHAEIAWRDTQWVVRDLASTNGTFRNGERLGRGQATPLLMGDVLGFGRGTGWSVVNVDPPAAFAVRVTGETVEAVDGLLLLPDAEEVDVSVFQDPGGGWRLSDAGGGVRELVGHVVRVRGEEWTVFLPTSPPPTLPAPANVVDSIELWRDDVRRRAYARIWTGAEMWELGARAHHRLLVVLARQRLHDARRHLPESSCGWLSFEDLADSTRQTLNTVYQQWLTLRRQLGPLVAAVIDRRGNRELRLATAQIVVHAAPPPDP